MGNDGPWKITNKSNFPTAASAADPAAQRCLSNYTMTDFAHRKYYAIASSYSTEEKEQLHSRYFMTGAVKLSVSNRDPLSIKTSNIKSNNCHINLSDKYVVIPLMTYVAHTVWIDLCWIPLTLQNASDLIKAHHHNNVLYIRVKWGCVIDVDYHMCRLV